MRIAVLIVVFAAIFCLSRCATIDAPLTLDADYAEREAAQMVDGDSCGPEFIQSSLPAALAKAVQPLADGPFRPVCERHDACYRLGEKPQAWCDDRMRDEMYAIRDTGNAGGLYSAPLVGASFCRHHARMYFGAINNTYGGFAYGGGPGGRIIAHRISLIEDAISDDEVTICVDVLNDTRLMQEYDVELHHADGRRIDREPDLHERNVRSGEQAEFCVSTNWSPRWSRSDLSEKLRISVRADTPDSFAISDDMVIVDVIEITLTDVDAD